MGGNLIKKLLRLLIGSKRQEKDDVTLREVDAGHVPGEKADVYDSIMTAKAETMSEEEIDATIEAILGITQNSEEEDPEDNERRERITAICKEILEERDHGKKIEKISELLSIGSGMTSIALFIIRLKEKTGL